MIEEPLIIKSALNVSALSLFHSSLSVQEDLLDVTNMCQMPQVFSLKYKQQKKKGPKKLTQVTL